MKFCLDCKVHTPMEGKVIELWTNLFALMVFCVNCGRRQYGEILNGI